MAGILDRIQSAYGDREKAIETEIRGKYGDGSISKRVADVEVGAALEERVAQREYADQAGPELVTPAKEMLENLGNRRRVLGVLRSLTPEQKEEVLKVTPGLAQKLGDDRGGVASRVGAALSRGLSHGVAQPIAELVGLGGTKEEIEFIRQLDSSAAREFHPHRPGDPWYASGPLQATEMTPWMASVVGGAGVGRSAATGLAGKAGLAARSTARLAKVGELAGITAAAFPGQYAQEVDSLKQLGMEDDWKLRLLAGATATVQGLIEGIVPNPFPGKVPLTEGAVKAARQYLWEAVKKAPAELGEEYAQGVMGGLGEHIAQYIDENAEDKSVGEAFSKGWEQAKEAALPMAFLLGTPAVVGAGVSAKLASQADKQIEATAKETGQAPQQVKDQLAELNLTREIGEAGIEGLAQIDKPPSTHDWAEIVLGDRSQSGEAPNRATRRAQWKAARELQQKREQEIQDASQVQPDETGPEVEGDAGQGGQIPGSGEVRVEGEDTGGTQPTSEVTSAQEVQVEPHEDQDLLEEVDEGESQAEPLTLVNNTNQDIRDFEPELAVDKTEEEGDPEPEREFSSTQVNLPESVASKTKELATKIPDSDLAEDGREDDPHVTVKYGLHTEDAEQVRPLLEGEGPITVRLGKTSIFPASESGKADVVKVDVESDDLRRLNAKISDSLEVTDTHPGYKPHVTLAYVQPGKGEQYAGMTDLEGTEIEIDKLVFSGKDGGRVEFTLRGTPAEEKPSGPKRSKGSVSGTKAGRRQESGRPEVRPEIKAGDTKEPTSAESQSKGSVFDDTDTTRLQLLARRLGITSTDRDAIIEELKSIPEVEDYLRENTPKSDVSEPAVNAPADIQSEKTPVKVVRPRTAAERKQASILDTFGVKVYFYEGGKPNVAGWFEPSVTPEVWINRNEVRSQYEDRLERGQSPEIATWGIFSHELFHAIRRFDPSTWNKFHDWVKKNDPKGYESAKQDYGKDAISAGILTREQWERDEGLQADEAIARYLEDRAGDFTFWDELGEKQPGLLAKIGRWLQEVLGLSDSNTLAGQARLAIESAMAKHGLTGSTGQRAAVRRPERTSTKRTEPVSGTELPERAAVEEELQPDPITVQAVTSKGNLESMLITDEAGRQEALNEERRTAARVRALIDCLKK